MNRITILVIFLMVSFIVKAQENIDLFIWAGQSNAQGWTGDAVCYPADTANLDESILLNWTFVNNESSNGEWLQMQAQKGRYPRGHFGPEVSFAREMKKAGYNPAIFKYCLGATGLARDWKEPGEGGIYDSMVRDLKPAIQKLHEKGFNVNIRGFIWIQGETDGGTDEAANAYYNNLNELINDLRTNVVKDAELQIILGVDEQHSYMVKRPVVVEAQKKLALNDKKIEYTSMYGFAKADATHLTPEALVEHGQRIFRAFMKTQPEANMAKNSELKIISYNIWNGFDWGKDTLRQTKLRQWVMLEQADVVGLQELCNYTPEKLAEDAKSWGHNYSVLLKESGYSVGLTSRFPIELKEKIFEGLHHGALHCQTSGIDFLVVHLHPGSIKRRREEVQVLKNKLDEIAKYSEKYIVLGDFNAHSPFDADLYPSNCELLKRLRKRNQGKGLNGNIDNGKLDYSVISSFLSFPLYDVVRANTRGIGERGSFPAMALGAVNKETNEQLNARLERIDYIMVSPWLSDKSGWGRVFNGKETWYLSDHYPVVAVFEVKKRLKFYKD